MEVLSKTITLTGLTIKLDHNDLDTITRVTTILESATKENAYELIKALGDDLRFLINKVIDMLPNVDDKRGDRREEDGDNHMSLKNMSPKKRPKNTKELVKVSINNMNDNCVLQAAISILGEFVSNNTIPVEAYIKQNKGVYVTEEELDRLLDKILAYNIKHPNKPLSVTIGE